MKAHKGVSTWCIDHPVATILLTIALVLVGLIAFPRLPIAPLPEAEFPTIQVSAQLPGASPDTMASSVATPLEVHQRHPRHDSDDLKQCAGLKPADPAIHPR